MHSLRQRKGYRGEEERAALSEVLSGPGCAETVATDVE
jgi:hypothetical protein